MKRVLYIVADFPPRRTSGVYRHVGLTKYLRSFGWQPTILSREGPPGVALDPTLLEGFPPETRVERTRYYDLDSWEQTAAAKAKEIGLAAPPPAGVASSSEVSKNGLLRRLLRWTAQQIRAYLYFPDPTGGWIPFAFLSAMLLHMKERFDLIYTSSPPRSAAVVGLLMKLVFGVPWAAEFRDPWYVEERPRTGKIDGWLERRIMRNADRVIVISEGNAEDLRQRHGLARNKVVVVSNGFDEREFQPGRSRLREFFPQGFVHLSHFGVTYPKHSGEFFPALAELIRELPELRQRLRVNVVGFPDDPDVREAAAGELRDVIQFYRFMPQPDAIQAMIASDCLLLFLGDRDVSRRSGLGKIYWYLRAGKPILAIAGEGGSKELIERGHAGWAIEPEDREGVKQAVRTLLAHAGNGSSFPPPPPEFVDQFRFDNLSHQLAQVLDGVVDGS